VLLLPALPALQVLPQPLLALALRVLPELVEQLVQGPPERRVLLRAPVVPERVLPVLPLHHKLLIIERAPL
jgi:hypothetical protein